MRQERYTVFRTALCGRRINGMDPDRVNKTVEFGDYETAVAYLHWDWEHISILRREKRMTTGYRKRRHTMRPSMHESSAC